jgi:hypothetical protein
LFNFLYVETKDERNPKDLQMVDDVRNAKGGTGKVEQVTAEQTTQEMYNLTVDEAHTFYVGDGQWLVHNTCQVFGGGEPSPTGNRLANLARAIYKGQLEHWWEFKSTTIALTEVNGQLYGTVNGGAAESGIQAIQNEIESMGGKFLPNPFGKNSHAEIFLYESLSDVETIGISHTGGPCEKLCTPYFTKLLGRVEVAYP